MMANVKKLFVKHEAHPVLFFYGSDILSELNIAKNILIRFVLSFYQVKGYDCEVEDVVKLKNNWWR